MTPATPPGLRALRVRLDPCPELPEVGAAWQALETHAAPNFFTSWTWIGCWLRHLPPTLRPLLLPHRRNTSLVFGSEGSVRRRLRLAAADVE